MKLIHLSDLHLGKRVNEFSMLEDQDYILREILRVIDEERADCVLIAGDVYDKSVPSAESVSLFDDFLVRLAGRNLKTLVISGNHDSPERIAFGGRLMDGRGVYLSPVYGGAVRPLTLQDEYGAVDFYLLPFLRPANVRRFFPDERLESYTNAVAAALRGLPLDPSRRNVLMTHQFITGAERSESEELSVGGSDHVDLRALEGFDYVALGHLHGPQCVGRETVRYCGSPLKYSFSEAKHVKSVTVAELGEKGSVTVRTVPLTPRRDLRELRGTYEALTLRQNYAGTGTGDYLHITLTDEQDIPDAMRKLQVIYPNLMKLDYDNTRTRTQVVLDGADEKFRQNPPELFEAFYEKQNNQPMNPRQRALVRALMEEIWEEEP